MKRTSLLAIAAAAATTFGVSAQAADLGGDCCADLEERIAELEATTARKGNRKVSLTVSGWVNEAVLLWDDGHESNAYQVTHMVAQTRFRFTGSAKINEDWSAGYIIELGVAGARSDGVDANNDDNGAGVGVRHSAWYLQSKTLGKVTVGQFSSATDGLIDAHIANIGHFASENAAGMVGSFRVRRADGTTGARLSAFMGGTDSTATPVAPGTDPAQIGEGNRNNVVRYDSPTLHGFTMSSAWGEDDMWDVALRYAGEFNGIKLMMNVGYQEWRDGNNDERNCFVGVAPQNDRSCSQFGIMAGVLHAPTGLFVEGVYGIRWDDNVPVGFDDTSTQWLVIAGIERKFFPLGKTTIFGEYQQWEIGRTAQLGDFGGEMTAWGLGINQQIDAAAMDLYLHYRNYDAEQNLSAVRSENFENFHQLMMGGRIQF